MSAAEIEAQARLALDAGLDVATHAIGDAALAHTLDAYDRLLAERPDLGAQRLRIEHVSYGRDQDLARAAALGVVLSVNPDFVAPDDHGLTMEDARLGPDRSDNVYAFGRLEELGANLAFGSDYFALPAAPMIGFFSAVTRGNADGLPRGGWHPGQRLSRPRALGIQTTLWPGGGAGPRGGGLAPGAPADLVLLSADPLAIPEAEILAIRVEEVFRAGSLP